MEIFRDGKSRQ